MLNFYHFKSFDTYPKIIHSISTKSPKLPYASSLALHTGQNTKSIEVNRKEISKALQIKATNELKFIVANQTHSDNIKIIDKYENRGWENSHDAIVNCDALITNIPHLVLTILTADCVPILLYDPHKKVVAVIHAGWKGTQSNIALKTVQKMQDAFSTNPKDIIAGIAPAIGRCCYEVGSDVAKHFFEYPKSYTHKKDKYMLDLPYLNQSQLIKAGLTPKNIELSNICTSCEVERFFSYRKENGCEGRFMSMIGLN